MKAKKKKVKPAKRAVNLYKRFHDAPPKNAKSISFDIESGLVRLGVADGILYRSNKWGTTNQGYSHKFKRPHPEFYTNLAGNILLIKGRFKITDRGIEG